MSNIMPQFARLNILDKGSIMRTPNLLALDGKLVQVVTDPDFMFHGERDDYCTIQPIGGYKYEGILYAVPKTWVPAANTPDAWHAMYLYKTFWDREDYPAE